VTSIRDYDISAVVVLCGNITRAPIIILTNRPPEFYVAGSSTPANDLLAELTRIGIDEMAYRKGQRYLTVIVDHGTGRLVWAAEG
jgi:transposase